jgi:hypothetical protein
MNTSLVNLEPLSRGTQADQIEIAAVLAPLLELAKDSPSLIASASTVRIDEVEFEVRKFLLLGQRGGGKPIRLAVFGGLDAARVESTAALVRVFSQLERSPSQARDFALFGFPITNVRGFTSHPEPFVEFERRLAARQHDGDLEYFRNEAFHWSFDGTISYRLDPEAQGFYATVRSELLSREVVVPALGALAGTYPVAKERIVTPGRIGISLPMSPVPRRGMMANPFEVEVFAPGRVPIEQRIAGLAAVLPEILRNYRRFISYAANL